jgi:uncharacterized protein YsxB (DUF464 family)
MKVEIPTNLDESKLNQSQVLFETLFKTIEDLLDEKDGYSKYISMEVIENVY